MTPHTRHPPKRQPAPLRAAPSLPWPTSWLDVDGVTLALHDTASRPGTLPAGQPVREVPLLVVHGINAAASAFEWEPFVQRESRRRRVVALDLPGFGQSDKPDLAYTPARMSAAVAAAIDWIGADEIDIAALSLGCEFVTEAVLAQPRRVRSLALVSPTGMEARRVEETYQDGATRELGWLRRRLRSGGLGRGLHRGLTLRGVMHLALSRSWGTPAYDPRLLQHARRCAVEPGAHHAPLDFFAGALSTVGMIERYRALPVPVWVAHGRRGGFTDFGACPERTGPPAAGQTFRLQREVFDTGSMPHFEQADDFDAAYQRFLAGLAPSAFRWREPQRRASTAAPRPLWARTLAHGL